MYVPTSTIVLQLGTRKTVKFMSFFDRIHEIDNCQRQLDIIRFSF